MHTEIKNLRIDNPCPFAPLKRNKNADGYACKSCKKTVIDFRGKTAEEIKCSVNRNTCGIFTIDQLSEQPKMKWSKQLLFYCLTFLSMLGVSVKPLKAQATVNNIDSTAISIKSSHSKATAIEIGNKGLLRSNKSKKKQGIFDRKKKTRVIGCPSF